MAVSTKFALVFLLGWAFFLAGIFAIKPSRQEAEENMSRFMSVLRKEQLSAGSPRFNDVLGNARAIIEYQETGFIGIRSIFQWMTSPNPRNDGVYNFLQFYTTESSGYIGLQNYDKSSKYTVLFSVWDATSASPGDNFECSTFGGEGIGYKCFNYTFPLISNAIYFLDVQIEGSTFRGYISEPQENLDSVTSNQVTRHLIGEITTPHEKLTNLIPFGYYNENYRDKDTCREAFELVTVNQAPHQYTKYGHANTKFTEAYLYNSECEVENILVALTADKKSTIYFTRPTALDL
ncbi:uncharacterized protein LOC119547842 [Drosophila subpulchrella]|uniref:uncharacterized protein LOC119547842 n=1 Tax=Drosophila subpulchrella TaxID=1486046 RepID=UPI0018A19672|nr:uncharacterized protein LOC119547842 [Drosophila subpulchrella]